MMTTTKRHSFDMQAKLGCDKNGKLTAFDIDFIVDNGAYMNIGIYVIFRCLWMLSGSYNIPNVNALARLVYTNNPAGGAARGAGPPQITFALESAMDMLADKIGMDRLEFRRINSLNRVRASRPATFTTNGRSLSFATLSGPTMTGRRMLPRRERQHSSAESASAPTPSASRAPGTGRSRWSSTRMTASRSFARSRTRARATIPCSLRSRPTFRHTMEKIRLMTRDTDHTTGMGPAAGSRMTYVAGGSLILAIEQLKSAMKMRGSPPMRA